MLQSISIQKVQPYLAAVAAGALVGGLSLVSPLIAFGLLLACSLLLILLRYPIAICYIMAVAVSVTAGVIRGKIFPLLRPNELLLILSVAFTVFVLLTNKDRWDNLNKGAPVFAAFIVLALGTIIIPIVYHQLMDHSTSIDGMMDVVAPIKYLLLFTVFLVIPTRSDQWHKIILGLLAGATIISLVGFLQAAKVGFAIDLISNWYASEHTASTLDQGGGRITSLLGAWNSLGMLLLAAVAIGWASLQVPEMRKYRAFVLGATVLSFLCLLVSGSFAGIGGLLLSIFLIEILTSPLNQTVKRFTIAFLISAIGFLIALPLIWGAIETRLMWQFNDGDRSLLPQTYVYRFWIWEDVFWPEIVKSPIFGTALEIPWSYRWWAYESNYILLLFRYGVIGLVTHTVWVALMLIWTYRQAQRGDQFIKMMGITAFSFLVVLLVTSYTNEVFTFTGIIDYLWILFALVANRKVSTTS